MSDVCDCVIAMSSTTKENEKRSKITARNRRCQRAECVVGCFMPRTKNTINTTMPVSSPSLVCGVGWVWSVESDTILSGEVAAPVENTKTAHGKKTNMEEHGKAWKKQELKNMKKKKLYFGET